MDGDEVFGRKGETTVVENGDDALGHLVRLLLVGVWTRHLGLRRIIIANPPPRLVLRDAPFNVILRRIKQELGRRETVHLLKPDGRRPGVGARAPPRLLGLEVAS